MELKHVIVYYLCYFNNIYELRFLVNRIQNGHYFNCD